MAFQVTEINECHNSQVVRSHEFVLLESCKPSCGGVIVFNYICSWFQGGNSQSWICELFPQSFPAELWSFQAAVDAVSTACLGCAGTAVVHYCSALEMEAKESLKIPKPVLLPAESQRTGQSHRESVIPSCGSQANIFCCCASMLQSLVMYYPK